MGRRAKSFTLAEKKARARDRQRERRQTAQYVFSHCYIKIYVDLSSSKSLISTQRYVTYWRVHGRQGSSPEQNPLCLPRLPKDLVALALQELPIGSIFFQRASKSAKLLDETGLDEWDGGPPYATGQPSEAPRELQFTERMQEVVHGRRIRLQIEEEAVWHQLTLSDLITMLYVAIDEWEIGHRFLAQYDDGHRESSMAAVWLQWAARRAYNLQSEISYYHT
jgi:hypothetical protein